MEDPGLITTLLVLAIILFPYLALIFIWIKVNDTNLKVKHLYYQSLGDGTKGKPSDIF